MARALLLAFLVLFSLTGGAAHAQTPPPTAPTTAPPTASPSGAPTPAAHEAALKAVEAELDLLLRTYAQPLQAGPLLDAAWQGIVDAANGGARALPALPFPKEAAWPEFTSRFGAVPAGQGAVPDAARLARVANEAMARSVGDCHTRFAPDYQKEIASLAGPEAYGGVGASILQASLFTPPAPGPVIVSLVEGAPAERAGLRAGDAVLAVDGTSTAGMTTARLAEQVRGAPGTTVRLRVDRPGAPVPLEFAVTRDTIQVGILDARPLAPPQGSVTIGYLHLRQFLRQSPAEVTQAFDRLREQGATLWVLDLRDNPGGELDAFRRVASSLIKEGPLAVMVDHDGTVSRLSADGRGFRDFMQPLAVLVDGRSASASELLAADLQDYGAARLFGTTTAGCFGTARPYVLPDGSALWLTVTTLKSGLAERDVHKIGVVPDEVIVRSRNDLAAGRDPQLDRAVAWLVCPVCPAEPGAAGSAGDETAPQ